MSNKVSVLANPAFHVDEIAYLFDMTREEVVECRKWVMDAVQQDDTSSEQFGAFTNPAFHVEELEYLFDMTLEDVVACREWLNPSAEYDDDFDAASTVRMRRRIEYKNHARRKRDMVAIPMSRRSKLLRSLETGVRVSRRIMTTHLPTDQLKKQKAENKIWRAIDHYVNRCFCNRLMAAEG